MSSLGANLQKINWGIDGVLSFKNSRLTVFRYE